MVAFLLQTEIVPLSLRVMESGSELSKTVATFIVQKVLTDDRGLHYICATYERFFAVATVLNNMVALLAEQPSARLLKHVVRCYHRLADNAKARDAMRSSLPLPFRDGSFLRALKNDATTKKCLLQLLTVLQVPITETQ